MSIRRSHCQWYAGVLKPLVKEVMQYNGYEYDTTLQLISIRSNCSSNVIKQSPPINFCFPASAFSPLAFFYVFKVLVRENVRYSPAVLPIRMTGISGPIFASSNFSPDILAQGNARRRPGWKRVTYSILH